MIQITLDDIKNSVYETDFIRGQKYYKIDMVKSFDILYSEESVLQFTSIVKGSSDNTYECKITMIKLPNRVSINGRCSCSIGTNCKHVVASCLQYLSNTNLKSKNNKKIKKKNQVELNEIVEIDKIELWLNNLTNNEESIDKDNYFITYRLFSNSCYDEDQLLFFKSKRLKNGSLSQGVQIESYKFVTNDVNNIATYHDKQIMELVKPIYEHNRYNQGKSKLTNKLGALILQEIIKTNRCYYNLNKIPIKFSDDKYDIAFELNEKDEQFKLNIVKQSNTKIFYTDIPYALDTANNELKQIDVEFDFLNKIGDIPSFNKDKVSVVYEAISMKKPQIKLVKHKDMESVAIDAKPIPLIIVNDNSVVVRFLYNQYDISYLPRYKTMQIYKNNTHISITRDLLYEDIVKAKIKEYGFDIDFKNNDIYFYIAKNISKQEQLIIWKAFLNTHITTLNESGYKIEYNDNFTMKFESNVDVVVENETHNNWFNLSFNLNFNGISQPIAPLVAGILEEFNSVDNMPDFINIEVDKNHFVEVETKLIKPIIKTIFELIEQKNKDESIKVSPYNAHLLANLDQNVQWKGGKEVLALSKKLKSFEGIEKVTPPKCFDATLRDYQQDGLNWLNFLYQFNFSGILADDMGLGKTIQTLVHLSKLKENKELDKSSLIVMPTSLLANWKNEAKKFAPNLTVLSLYGNNRDKDFDKIDQYDLILTTYPLITRDKDVFDQHNFLYIILDEAQKIKNPKTKMTIAIKILKSDYKLALSGTPIENHLGELWSIFSFLMPGFLDTYKFFKNYYQIPIEKENNFDRQILLNKKIKPFMLRRTKEVVIDELPSKSIIVKYTQFDNNQSKLYESIRVTMEEKVRQMVKDKGIGSSHITILDALLKLRQVCCDPSLLKLEESKKVKESAKLELLLDLIAELLTENRKILLFSQFTSMLSVIESKIEQLGIKYTKLTGSTKNREKAIEKFTKGDASIFLISLKAGGVGLNLVEADTVIHYDPWWNPAVENQATDRAYRIGQNKSVFVYKLIVENTIEQKILELQARKQALQDSIYSGNKEKTDLKLSGNELLDLLKI